MAPPLIQLGDISLSFGSTPLLDGVELSVSSGERVCLVGRNGSGKSTLLKIAAGLIEPDHGTRFVQPGATIRYLPQEPDLSAHRDHARLCAGRARARRRCASGAVLSGAARACRRRGSRRGCRAARRGARRSRAFSRRRPTSCLLDEPTNHLDLTTIEWLERDLDQRRTALVLISHDRRFLETLSRSTVWLDRGKARRIELGFGALRRLARRRAGGGGARSAQARPQDRGRAALASLRRDRPAQAQRAPLFGLAEIAAGPARVSRGRRQGRHRRGAGG